MPGNVKSPSFVPGDSAASILAHYEEQARVLEKALGQTLPWEAIANSFPELYEVEHALRLKW